MALNVSIDTNNVLFTFISRAGIKRGSVFYSARFMDNPVVS